MASTLETSESLTIISCESLIAKNPHTTQKKMLKPKKSLSLYTGEAPSKSSNQSLYLKLQKHESKFECYDIDEQSKKRSSQQYGFCLFLRIQKQICTIGMQVVKLLHLILGIFSMPFLKSLFQQKRNDPYSYKRNQFSTSSQNLSTSNSFTQPFISCQDKQSQIMTSIEGNQKSTRSHLQNEYSKENGEQAQNTLSGNSPSLSQNLIHKIDTTTTNDNYYQLSKSPSIYHLSCQDDDQTPFTYMLKSVQDSLKLYEQHSFNLVLDLDETLVHSSERVLTKDAQKINVSLKEGTKRFFVHERNYLSEFLNQCAMKFNIYIFTASAKEYAEEVVRLIDPTGLIKKIYNRQNCFFDGKQLNKSLQDIGFDLSKTVLVDNSLPCVQNNSANSILIPDYRAESIDKELIKLECFLNKMIEESPEDIRKYLDKFSRN